MNPYSLISDVYECALGDAEWKSLLPKMYSALGCSATSFSIGDHPNEKAIQEDILGFDEDWLCEYEEHWDHLNPWRISAFEFTRALRGRQPNIAWHAVSTIDMNNFWRTDVYRGSLSKMNLSDLICMPIYVKTPLPVALCLYCGREKSLFTSDDRALADILAPHFNRAGLIAEKLSHAGKHFGSGAFPVGSDPAILISARQDIIEQTEAVEELIFRPGLMIQKNSQVMFVNPKAQEKLKMFIERDRLSGSFGKATYQLCSIEVSHDVTAIVYRIPSILDIFVTDGLKNNYIVSFETGASVATEPMASLAEEYSLTDAEEKVATLLADGLRPIDISKKRGTTLNTVRWQIRQIYGKMNVSSQTEFFQKIIEGVH